LTNRFRLKLGFGALLLGTLPATAQTVGLPTEFVEELTGRAREALPLGRLEDGSNVPPETEAERARPLVPRSAEIQIIQRGMLTGQMQFCGMDWERESYLPYMQALRSHYRGKPMAYLGLLHGISQAITTTAMTDQGSVCDDTIRARLTAAARGLIRVQ
jgi:hypothetical protein